MQASQAELEAYRDELMASWELLAARVMPNGRIYGVHRFIYTYGLLEDIERETYGNRWCYENRWFALAALFRWDGKDRDFDCT